MKTPERYGSGLHVTYVGLGDDTEADVSEKATEGDVHWGTSASGPVAVINDGEQWFEVHANHSDYEAAQ